MELKRVAFLIQDDGSLHIHNADSLITVNPQQFMSLCDTCSEYLGFTRREIDEKRLAIMREEENNAAT